MAAKRNYPWTRDELILALDLYFRIDPLTVRKNAPEILELSEVLNSLPIHSVKKNQENFRNSNGVYMKLQNFKSIDPDYSGVGLERGNQLEEPVWNEFVNDRDRLKNVVNAIKSTSKDIFKTKIPISNTTDGFEEEFPEGKILQRTHTVRERNTNLIKKKKHWFLEEHGTLFCEACGFDFSYTYGSIGEGYIECHHLTPLSELRSGSRTKLEDLAMLCSNCHSIIHRKRPWLTVEGLKNLIRE